MTGATQHATRLGHQREDVARLNNVIGAGIACHGGLHGAGAIRGGNTGGDAFTGLDGHGELGTETTAVALHHQRQLQQLAALPGHGHADQSTAILGHEIDGLGGHMLGGHDQITLVFPVFIIHQDNHLALADVFDQFFNTVELHNFTRCWS